MICEKGVGRFTLGSSEVSPQSSHLLAPGLPRFREPFPEVPKDESEPSSPLEGSGLTAFLLLCFRGAGGARAGGAEAQAFANFDCAGIVWTLSHENAYAPQAKNGC